MAARAGQKFQTDPLPQSRLSGHSGDLSEYPLSMTGREWPGGLVASLYIGVAANTGHSSRLAESGRLVRVPDQPAAVHGNGRPRDRLRYARSYAGGASGSAVRRRTRKSSAAAATLRSSALTSMW
jgi:hypothetical protein